MVTWVAPVYSCTPAGALVISLAEPSSSGARSGSHKAHAPTVSDTATTTASSSHITDIRPLLRVLEMLPLPTVLPFFPRLRCFFILDRLWFDDPIHPSYDAMKSIHDRPAHRIYGCHDIPKAHGCLPMTYQEAANPA